MARRYKHSSLGEFHKLDLSRSNVAVAMIPNAMFSGFMFYLNGGEDLEPRKRVIRLLQLMLKLENLEAPVWDEQIEGPTMIDRAGRSLINPVLKKMAPEKYKQQVLVDETQNSINRELAGLRFSPWVYCPFGKFWKVSWLLDGKAPKLPLSRKGVAQLDEGSALQFILDLARAGQLGRVRQCSCCGKWLYAKFRHQNYCSTKCQQDDYRNSDEWRTRRRLYMREYRKH